MVRLFNTVVAYGCDFQRSLCVLAVFILYLPVEDLGTPVSSHYSCVIDYIKRAITCEENGARVNEITSVGDLAARMYALKITCHGCGKNHDNFLPRMA